LKRLINFILRHRVSTVSSIVNNIETMRIKLEDLALVKDAEHSALMDRATAAKSEFDRASSVSLKLGKLLS
jgi:hypothetical protein